MAKYASLPQQAAAPPSQRQTTNLHAPPEALARAAGFRVIAGVDEAGRGPWAGPVVAGAVIVTRLLRGVRIDDSKRLTALQRARAFDRILQETEVGIGIVCAEDVDRHRIVPATFAAMQEAVRELPRPPELVLVDGLFTPALAMPAWAIPHGDARSYAIACASIVAKVTRDRLMTFYHRLAPQYAFHRHKGYGTSIHHAALAACGPSVFHRLTFQPVAAVMPRVLPAASENPPSRDAHLTRSLAQAPSHVA